MKILNHSRYSLYKSRKFWISINNRSYYIGENLTMAADTRLLIRYVLSIPYGIDVSITNKLAVKDILNYFGGS